MSDQPTYHEQVRRFRKLLIEVTLFEHGGNRSRAARALGLQRTYLLRLIRELGVAAPPRAPSPRYARPPGQVHSHQTDPDPHATVRQHSACMAEEIRA